MPGLAEIQQYEQALIAQGGRKQKRIRPLPDQLLVWRPENTDWKSLFLNACSARKHRPADPGSGGIGACLRRTDRGHRGVLYESGDGITALVDFQGPTVRTENFGFAAPCIIRPLQRPVPRAELSRITSLDKLFGKPGVPRSTQNLSVSQAKAIATVIDNPLPPFILMPEVAITVEGLKWNRATQAWGAEGPMRDAVLNSETAWRALFSHRPQAEVGWGTTDRYDLFSEPDRAVAEFKLEATNAALAQLDRYLDGLRRNRGGDWKGHIVWGNSCARGLVEAVKTRSDVTLWHCERMSDTSPHLVRTD